MEGNAYFETTTKKTQTSDKMKENPHNTDDFEDECARIKRKLAKKITTRGESPPKKRKVKAGYDGPDAETGISPINPEVTPHSSPKAAKKEAKQPKPLKRKIQLERTNDESPPKKTRIKAESVSPKSEPESKYESSGGISSAKSVIKPESAEHQPSEGVTEKSIPPRRKKQPKRTQARSECSHPSIDPATCLCIVCGQSAFMRHICDLEDVSYRERPVEKRVDLFGPGEMTQFPPEVIKKANEISERMMIGSNRKTRRMYRKFFCLYNAHLELRMVAEARYLASRCGLKPNQISAALTSFCYAKSGYESMPPDRYELPIEEHASIKIMKKQAIRLELTEESISRIENILLSALKSPQKDTILARDIGTIAAASIHVFCKLYQHEIPAKKYKENAMEFSASTISQAKTEILNGYNGYFGD